MRRLAEQDVAAKPVPWRLGGSIAVGTAGLFALDLITPLGNAFSFLYLVVVYFASGLPRWKHAAAAAGATTALIVVGAIFSPPGGMLWLGLVHRGVTIAAIWAFLELERRRLAAAGDARATEIRFERLVDALPAMIWMSGPDKACTYFNRPWLVFRGRTLEQERGAGWTEGLHPDDMKTCLRTYKEAFEARRPFAMEYRLRRHDGEYRWVRDIGQPFEAPAGEFAGYVGGCIDITERKAQHDSLRDNLAVLKEAQRIADFGCWEWRVPEGKLLWSEELYRLFGRKKSEYDGNLATFMGLIHPEDREKVRNIVSKVVADPRPFEYEKRILHPDGTVRYQYTRGRPVETLDGRATKVVGACLDVTEQKVLETSLRAARERAEQLSSQLLQAQEGERAGLARELHDDIGQVLAAAAINIDRARAAVTDAQAHALLDESIEELEQAVERVRELALALRPSLLDDLGLAPALEWHLEREAKRAGVALDFRSEIEGCEVSPNAAIVCYRIAQEVMTNIMRHAQAKQVTARLEAEGAMLRFTLSDDGAGFDVEEALGRRGGEMTLGFTGMQERAALAGGRLEIESAPGRGTTVTLELPLAAGDAANGAEA